MENTLKLKGHGYFERRTKDGKKIDSWECDNLIVTAGDVLVAKLINGVSATYMNTIAIGTDTGTPPAIGQTALIAENQRALATLTYLATAKAVFEYTFSFGGSYTIAEAGVFNNSTSGGDMLDRFQFTGKAVDGTTNLYVKITITCA